MLRPAQLRPSRGGAGVYLIFALWYFAVAVFVVLGLPWGLSAILLAVVLAWWRRSFAQAADTPDWPFIVSFVLFVALVVGDEFSVAPSTWFAGVAAAVGAIFGILFLSASRTEGP